MTIVACIGCLLLWSGPSAVAGFVMAVYIDTIQRSAARAFSHVSKKGRKIGPPRFAYRNTAAAVILISSNAFSLAAPFHRAPTLVGSAARLALLCLYLSSLEFMSHHLATQTTTRLGVASPDILSANDFASSASTLDKPTGLPVFSIGWFLGRRNDRESTVLMTSEVSY